MSENMFQFKKRGFMKKSISFDPPKDPEVPILLIANRVNIILGTEGILKLPDPDEKNLWLKIVFMDIGNFYIDGNGKKIKLGNFEAYWVITRPGQGPFDTQPEFLWFKKRDIWIAMTGGNLEFPIVKKNNEIELPELPEMPKIQDEKTSLEEFLDSKKEVEETVEPLQN